MTTKEQLMKVLLEDEFNKTAVKLIEVSTGQTAFDVAEVVAQGAINEHPSISDISELQGYALELIFNQIS